MGYVNNAATFLISFIFGFFILLVLLRFMLALVRADFYNPVSQFIVKVTNPLLVPLRRLIPAMGRIDTATVIVLLGLQILETFLILLVQDRSIPVLTLVAYSAVQLLDLVLKIYLFGILIQVILSWVAPQNYNPVVGILHSINEPLLGPARRILPPISGFDLSPILVMVALQLASFLVIAPLNDVAMSLGR